MILVIPIFIAHRGCPHDCLFCNQQKISGSIRDVEKAVPVAEVIREWLGRKNDRCRVQVAFYGGSFTCLPEAQQVELLSGVQSFIDRGEVDTIRLSTRPDCVDQRVCNLLINHRVGVVELGVQSLSDRVLAAVQRGHSAEQSHDAFRLLKSAGMEVGLQLMPGLPAESNKSFLHTIDKVIEIRPDFVRLYPVLVIEDSGLEKLYHTGRYRPLSLQRAIALTAKCCMRLENGGIKVVRMGLQPTISLESSIVAGPYHPAFGELVRSRIWLRKIRARLYCLDPGQKLLIYVSHRDISAVIGARKSNIRRLEGLGFSGSFTVKVDKSMERRSIRYVVC